MATARFSLVCSMMLTLTAVAPPPAAQTAPPVVNSSAEAQALGGLVPDVIEEIPKHLSVQKNTRQREFLRFSTTHWNFGDGALQVRGGGQESPCVVDGVPSICTFAMQEILDAHGQILPFTLPASRCFTPSTTIGIRLMSPNSRSGRRWMVTRLDRVSARPPFV